MSLADATLDRLHAVAGKHLGNNLTHATVRDWLADALMATDVVQAMQHTVQAVIAAEAAAAAAKAAAEEMRIALAAAMEETGAPAIRSGIHTASVSAGRASVHVTDEAQIPAEFMRQPPPAPDKTAIAKAMQAGRQVPGAVLRNGAPVLSIRANPKGEKK